MLSPLYLLSRLYTTDPLQTFACMHYQQVIWEVFDHVITGWDVSGDKNETFLQSVKDTQDKMDKGIHIGWFGQLQGDSPSDRGSSPSPLGHS